MIVARNILRKIGIKKDTTTQKRDCFFNIVAVIKDGKW